MIVTTVQLYYCMCQLYHTSPPKAPLDPWEYPQRPWSRINIDRAGLFMGHNFLIIVDLFSKWIEAFIVPFTYSEATIKVYEPYLLLMDCHNT